MPRGGYCGRVTAGMGLGQGSGGFKQVERIEVLEKKKEDS